MSMRTRAAAAGVALILGVSGAVAQAGAAQRTVLVVPTRYSVVQFAFDMVTLRNVYLVAYDTRAERGKLVLHFWDAKKQDWVRTSLDEYRAGALFDQLPGHVALVGSDKDLPAELVSASGWAGGVQRIPSLIIVDMVNALDQTLKFTPSEWHWLAKRYGLQLTDLNEDRRHYGRYGKSGSPAPAPQPAPQASHAPAAPMVPIEAELENLGQEAQGISAPQPVPPPKPAQGQ